MRANESDVNNLKLVLDSHDQTVVIAFDIEHHPVVAQYAGGAVRSFDVKRALQLARLTSVYHALKAHSASGCSDQNDFSIFTEITRMRQDTLFPNWEQD